MGVRLTGGIEAGGTVDSGKLLGEFTFGVSPVPPPAPTGGKVDDVKVNGESVVEDRVAEIDLAGYARLDGAEFTGDVSGVYPLHGDSFATKDYVDSVAGSMDYNDLENKPSIEGVTLMGNKNYPDINLDKVPNDEIQSLLDLVFN